MDFPDRNEGGEALIYPEGHAQVKPLEYPLSAPSTTCLASLPEWLCPAKATESNTRKDCVGNRQAAEGHGEGGPSNTAKELSQYREHVGRAGEGLHSQETRSSPARGDRGHSKSLSHQTFLPNK